MIPSVASPVMLVTRAMVDERSHPTQQRSEYVQVPYEVTYDNASDNLIVYDPKDRHLSLTGVSE